MMPPTDLSEGLRRKDVAIIRLAARHSGLIRQARRALLIELLAHNRATIDDVRRVVPCPDGVSPKAFGAMPKELARDRIIEHDGFAKSTRPQSHARPVSVWRLIDRAGAEAWLATHAELPDAEMT